MVGRGAIDLPGALAVGPGLSAAASSGKPPREARRGDVSDLGDRADAASVSEARGTRPRASAVPASAGPARSYPRSWLAYASTLASVLVVPVQAMPTKVVPLTAMMPSAVSEAVGAYE